MMTIIEALSALETGKITAVALVQELLAKIAAKNSPLNVYLEVFADAPEQAEQADKKRRAGEKGLLLGIPLAIKDNILIEGKIASAASKMLANYRASYDATVIKKLKAAGAIFLGRTNMDEFAMGSSTESSAFGPTRNPRDPERVAGGSSGGSAAAVAAGLALGALGSDTGGSVRQPASYCGVVGFKPTYGAVSRFGLIAMASSLDQIGPIAQTVADAEIIFKAISGRDPLDATSVNSDLALSNSSQPFKIGIPEDFLIKTLDSETQANFRDALEKLTSLGFQIQTVALPNLKYSLACYYIIMPAEASTNLARYDGLRYGFSAAGEDLLGDYCQTRGRGFGAEVKRRIMLGTYVLSAGYYDAYYQQAVRVRELIRQDLAQVFQVVDLLALPTTPTTAFRLGEKTADPLQMYLEDIFTVPANIAGIPAISLPHGRDSQGLPFGLQLMAPAFGENRLFAVGKKFEQS